MKIVKLKKNNQKEVILEAVEILRRGGVIIYPTETVYGIGVDATNQSAVNKILNYKTKRQDKPISVAVSDLLMAKKYVKINQSALNIYQNFLPGPITVVSVGKNKVANGVQSVRGTLGIRWPKYSFILSLVKKFGSPITSTSANATGKKAPHTVADIFKYLSVRQKKIIDLVIDAGVLPPNKPSTVVDTTLHDLTVLRAGDLKLTNARTYFSNNEQATVDFAKSIFEEVKKYFGKKLIVFQLQGELGVGKTFFTRSFASVLGIKKNVSSPTFVLSRQYDFFWQKKKIDFYHLDVYRLFSATELNDLRPEKIFSSPNIIFIEWPEKIASESGKYFKGAVLVNVKFRHLDEFSREMKYEIKNN